MTRVTLAKTPRWRIRQDPSNTTSPVMVLLHGGDWSSGGAQAHNAPMLASAGIVVVTLGYRLGMMGYADASNLGLQDQGAALKWVAENIEDYEGDVGQVTLVGAGGAGAQAAIIHALDQQEESLFQQVAILSDERGLFAPLSASTPSPSEVLPTCEAETLAECIMELSDKELMDTIEEDTTWQPVIEGDVVRGDINEVFGAGQFPQVPMLVGAPGSSFGPVPPNTTVSPSEVKEELVELLTDKYGDDAELVAELTLWEYARTKEPTMLYNIVNQVQDQQAAVTVRALLVKMAAADNSSIYRYVLGKQDVSNADLLAPPTDASPLLPDEKIMSDRLTAIVQDFVLESTPGASLPPPANSWATVTPDHAPFFELSAMSIPRTTQDINPPRPDFWNQHIPEVIDITDSSDSAEDETLSEGGVSEAYFIATWVLVALLILLLILLVIAVVVLIKYKRGKYNMDREGTVKYVAK